MSTANSNSNSSSSSSAGGVRTERCIMHRFHLPQGRWSKQVCQIQVEVQPFAQGSFRSAYRGVLRAGGDDGGKKKNSSKAERVVFKFARDRNTPRSMYFQDVEAQVYAQHWALQFNQRKPAMRVSFVDCYVLELVDRPGRPVCGCETLISGDFRKYNNNVGAAVVSTDQSGAEAEAEMDSKTAQAFSHFTYEESNRSILICDIQGVRGTYTDPQIHTQDVSKFGGGNLGETG
eukprot:TRINITY_DN66080_c5_g3_i2.p1 TRINITY_DN66080_c5_g3~~TRINITY_DN66080_c5_g3_i2.p1  ORF type:complete len:232 (-),score=91.11 TRINITY_DN66080_c5_g3_i2:255-950(-)